MRDLKGGRKPLFAVGRIFVSSGAVSMLQERYGGQAERAVWGLIARHAIGDWCDLKEEEYQANVAAVASGGVITSRFVDVGDLVVQTVASRQMTILFTENEGAAPTAL